MSEPKKTVHRTGEVLGTTVCGSDESNQATTDRPENVTCPACCKAPAVPARLYGMDAESEPEAGFRFVRLRMRNEDAAQLHDRDILMVSWHQSDADPRPRLRGPEASGANRAASWIARAIRRMMATIPVCAETEVERRRLAMLARECDGWACRWAVEGAASPPTT